MIELMVSASSVAAEFPISVVQFGVKSGENDICGARFASDSCSDQSVIKQTQRVMATAKQVLLSRLHVIMLHVLAFTLQSMLIHVFRHLMRQ